MRTNGSTPDVFVFEEDKGALFKRLYLPRVLVTETIMVYKQDSDGDYTHTFVLDPTVEDRPSTRVRMAPQVCWQVARQWQSAKNDRRIRPLGPQDRASRKTGRRPILALPLYEGQDLNIDGRDGLDVLNRLNELQGALTQRA